MNPYPLVKENECRRGLEPNLSFRTRSFIIDCGVVEEPFEIKKKKPDEYILFCVSMQAIAFNIRDCEQKHNDSLSESKQRTAFELLKAS